MDVVFVSFEGSVLRFPIEEVVQLAESRIGSWEPILPKNMKPMLHAFACA
jgi:hypothetical protein